MPDSGLIRERRIGFIGGLLRFLLPVLLILPLAAAR